MRVTNEADCYRVVTVGLALELREEDERSLSSYPGDPSRRS
jgi:hypothetical protein